MDRARDESFFASIPRVVKLLWLGVTLALTVLLHEYELEHFDCNEVPIFSIVAGFCLMGILTACPIVVVFVFLKKKLRLWLRFVLAFLAFIAMMVLALVVWIIWLLSHICP
jgi:hypothetical protein